MARAAREGIACCCKRYVVLHPEYLHFQGVGAEIKNIQGGNTSDCMMTSHESKGYFTYWNDSPLLDRNIVSSSQDLDNQTECDKYYTSLAANSS